jgi:threonine aldolase
MSGYEGMRGTNGSCICDLRSDTVTKPDAAMRAAMAAAEVGDDVYGEDPTVNRLESILAERLGKEAAVLFPTGTQSNLAAVLAHCGRGDEVLLGEHNHIRFYEAAGASVLGGVALWPLPHEADGCVSAASVTGAIKADDPHFAVTRLLCVENTIGGRAIALDSMRAPAKAAREAGLSVHLDGARFFNATTALGCGEAELAEVVDTVSICLSKGLGTPMGSALVGDTATITRARRLRKMLGGGMRQSGIIAAAAIHALDHNVGRLGDDHARASRLADALLGMGHEARAATNMVFLKPPADYDALNAHMMSCIVTSTTKH